MQGMQRSVGCLQCREGMQGMQTMHAGGADSTECRQHAMPDTWNCKGGMRGMDVKDAGKHRVQRMGARDRSRGGCRGCRAQRGAGEVKGG